MPPQPLASALILTLELTLAAFISDSSKATKKKHRNKTQTIDTVSSSCNMTQLCCTIYRKGCYVYIGNKILCLLAVKITYILHNTLLEYFVLSSKWNCTAMLCIGHSPSSSAQDLQVKIPSTQCCDNGEMQ